MDSVCIDTVLLSMRVIDAVFTTIASRFGPGHHGFTVHTTVISCSKKHLWPESSGARWVKGEMTVEAERKAGLCFGETQTIEDKVPFRIKFL